MKTIKKYYLKIFLIFLILLFFITISIVKGNNRKTKGVFYNDTYIFNLTLKKSFVIEVPAYFKIIDYKNIKNAKIKKKYYSPVSFFVEIYPERTGIYTIYFLNSLNNHIIKYLFNIKEYNVKSKESESKYFILNKIDSKLSLIFRELNNYLKSNLKSGKIRDNSNRILSLVDNSMKLILAELKIVFSNNLYNIDYDLVNLVHSHLEFLFKYNYFLFPYLSKYVEINKYIEDYLNKKNTSNLENNKFNLYKQFPLKMMDYLIKTYYQNIENIDIKNILNDNITEKNNDTLIGIKKNYNNDFNLIELTRYFIYFLKGYKYFLNSDYYNASKCFAVSKESSDRALRSLSFYYQAQNHYFLKNIEVVKINYQELIKLNNYFKYESILGLLKIYFKEENYSEMLDLFDNSLIENLFKNDKLLIAKIKKRIYNKYFTNKYYISEGNQNLNVNIENQNNKNSNNIKIKNNNIDNSNYKILFYFKDYFYFYYGVSIIKNNLKDYDIGKQILKMINNKNFEYYNATLEVLDFIKKNIEDY